MIPALREALSRHAARLAGSRYAKPAARTMGVAGGLLLLALVGRTAAGGMGTSQPPAPSSSASAPASTVSAVAAPIASNADPLPAPTESATSSSASASPPRSPASPEDPVSLNTATFEDLRRLPGVGAKRANAILSLRTHLGRFRSIEDLLKVKGIGRAMLKRLRPLVRLDVPAAPDAGIAALP
jgi:competence protein ComEA